MNRYMRRSPLRQLALTLALALVALLACAGTSAAASLDYVALTDKGVADARAHWWNSGQHWYDDELNSTKAFPLATVWSIVPLFEAVDGVAIGSPTAAHVQRVRTFANFAEHYWNNNIPPSGAYAPYPGDGYGERTQTIWFDDNSWWGLGFVDAYRATHDKRYLTDAARASRFVNANGWDGQAGMWWNTKHPHHSLEAMAAATALAAELYQYTRNTEFRTAAYRYINWADRYSRNSKGLYANSQQPVMTYVEGSMIGAHLALCQAGEAPACTKVERLAQAAWDWWGGGQGPNFAPQFDTIFFRYLIQLSAHDRNPKWRAWAERAASSAYRNARVAGDLYLRFWDGTAATAHHDGAGQFRYGMIQTHAAPVALFAWLAAVPAK